MNIDRLAEQVWICNEIKHFSSKLKNFFFIHIMKLIQIKFIKNKSSLTK